MTASSLLFPLSVDPKKPDETPELLRAFGYGSPLIYPKERIREGVLTLEQAILTTSDPMRHHNFYEDYTYLCAMFCFGLRPRNRPTLPYERAAAIVSDKQSVRHHEQRVLTMPKVAINLMEQLHGGFEALRFHIAKMRPAVMLCEWTGPFYLVDAASASMADFTLAAMRATFKDLDIFPKLPLNFPRQYLRNYLYHAGLANDAIDAWFGHLHEGREILHKTSGTIPTKALGECLTRVERLLDELGFKELKYLPKLRRRL
jgi:hypothetical protein